MASGWCPGGDSEVLLLLEEYCSHRRSTATRPCPVIEHEGPGPGVIRPQGPGPGVIRPQGPGPGVKRPQGPRPGPGVIRPQGPRPGPGVIRPQGPGPGPGVIRPQGPRPGPGVIRPQGPGPGVIQLEGPGPGVIRPQGPGPGPGVKRPQGPGASYSSFLSTTVPAIVKFRSVTVKLESDSVGKEHGGSGSESQTRSSAVDRLVQITEAAPVPQAYEEEEGQDELVQKLVNLMITFGDDINQKICESPLLQQQLSNMNYELFEKVTSTVQSLVDPGRGRGRGRGAAGAGFESQVQQQKIAWAFEVTSRLSVLGVVQRRRLLSYGDKYIQQHHSAWVQEQGGWDEVFAVD